MTSFKRWLGAGAIVLVALALVACPAMVPKATGSIPAMSFAHDDMTARTVALGSFFADDDNATYSAESSKPAVATVSVKDATLTVTPKDAGTTTVTVTATSSTGRDSATQTFAVTIASPPTPPPPPANNAPEMRTILNVSLDVGASTPVDLADYASDADGDTLVYGAQSLNPAVATVTPSGLAIPGSVITIMGVSGGEAQIAVGVTDGKSAPVTRTFLAVVTAPAPDNRDPVLLTSNLIPHVVYSDFRIGATMDYNLSMHFQDPDADVLTYGAESADPMVASISGLDANTGMFTLTAVGKGNTSVTVMAMDPDGASAQQTFNVGVGSKAPMATTASTDVDLMLKAGMDVSRTFDLNDYFEDDLGETLTYALVSNTGEMYATAVLDVSMLTITAVAAGDATVTVSAADSDNDPVELAFMVMVHAEPDAPNNAPTLTDMAAPMVDLVLEDSPSSTLDVSMYFMDADGDTLTYTAMSSDTGVATESVSGSMVTITAAADGSATVTVTASDGNGGSVDLAIMVTVTAPDNMAPRLKSGMMLRDYLIEIVDSDTDTNNDTSAADTADNRPLDLSMYFEDPDGVLLFYEVTKTETPDDSDNTPVIDLHSVAADPDATPAAPASGAAPDGTDDDATMVIIEPRNPGTATVMVTVYDIGKKSYTDTFMVKVVAANTNAAPVATGDAIPNQLGAATETDNKRLKIGEPRKVVDDALVTAHFTDTTVSTPGSGDFLTFSVKYYAADVTATDGVIPAGTDELDAAKVGVTASLSRTTWDGDPNSKITLTLTGVRGTDNSSDTEADRGHVVALVATDTYDVSRAKLFRVMVNNPPKAEGAQASDPKTLGGETMYMDIGFNTDDTADAIHIPLVADDAGYFHDPDADDTLDCRINSSSGADYAAFSLQNLAGDTADPRGLRIDPKKQGKASVTIACVDTFDVSSPADTLNIEVTHQNISRQ